MCIKLDFTKLVKRNISQFCNKYRVPLEALNQSYADRALTAGRKKHNPKTKKSERTDVRSVLKDSIDTAPAVSLLVGTTNGSIGEVKGEDHNTGPRPETFGSQEVALRSDTLPCRAKDSTPFTRTDLSTSRQSAGPRSQNTDLSGGSDGSTLHEARASPTHTTSAAKTERLDGTLTGGHVSGWKGILGDTDDRPSQISGPGRGVSRQNGADVRTTRKHLADKQSISSIDIEHGIKRPDVPQIPIAGLIEDDDVLYINELDLPELRDAVDAWLSERHSSKDTGSGAVRLFGSCFAACAVEEGLLEAMESEGEVCKNRKLS